MTIRRLGCVALAIAVLGGGLALASPAAAAEENSFDPSVVLKERVIISDDEVSWDHGDFGVVEFDVGMYSVTALPGTNQVVGVVESSGRIARLDHLTAKLHVGDVVPNHSQSTKPVITSDGRSVVLVTWDFAGNTVMYRYDVATLSRVATINLTAGLDRGRVVGVRAVSGRSNSIMIDSANRIFLVEDDVVAPNRLDFDSLSGLDTSTEGGALIALAVYTDPVVRGLHRLEIDDEGVTLGELLAPIFIHYFVVRNGEIVTGDSVYDLSGKRLRTATPFDRAVDDPTAPYRYGRRDGDPEGINVVYDKTSGKSVTDPRYCALSPTQDELLGDGVAASVDSGKVRVVDILDACGAYGELTPVQPARVFDSRTGQGQGGTPKRISGGQTVRVKIHGLAGVPKSGVESVVLNVTAIRQLGAGSGKNFVTVWPAGFDRPTVSNLNVGNNEIVGNMVTVSTAAGGFVDVYSNVGTVDLTVDVMGYFASAAAPSAARYFDVVDTRLFDTRPFGMRLRSDEVLTIDARRDSQIGQQYEGKIVALVVNVTTVQPTSRGHLRIFPTGSPLPDASSTNFEARTNTNRLVTVKARDGAIDIWNSAGETHLTVDVVGMYVEKTEGGFPLEAGSRFIGVVPFRELDTRSDSPFDNGGWIPAGSLISMSGWRSNIDLVANLTAIRPSTTGYVTAGPWSGQFDPFFATSSLNFAPGAVVANQAIIRPSESGEIGIFNSAGRTHVAMDVFGYYTP